MTILLVDLSSFAHRIWHAYGASKGGDATSNDLVRNIRQLAKPYAHAAICCDVPGVPSFRVAIDPRYKAGRKPWDELLVEQYRRGGELLAEYFPVLEAPGFEADDLIATLTTWVRAQRPRHDVVIASSDKDCLQLLEPGVCVYSPATQAMMQAAHVREKYGVEPWQMRDFLVATGDPCDGVAGIPHIGAVKAAKLLRRWGTLQTVFGEVLGHTAEECRLRPSTHKALVEGIVAAELARQLVTLRTNVPIEIPSPWAVG